MIHWLIKLETESKIALLGIIVAIAIGVVQYNISREQIKDNSNTKTTIQKTNGDNSANYSNINGNISIKQ